MGVYVGTLLQKQLGNAGEAVTRSKVKCGPLLGTILNARVRAQLQEQLDHYWARFGAEDCNHQGRSSLSVDTIDIVSAMDKCLDPAEVVQIDGLREFVKAQRQISYRGISNL